jgi:hypothetical protein
MQCHIMATPHCMLPNADVVNLLLRSGADRNAKVKKCVVLLSFNPSLTLPHLGAEWNTTNGLHIG